MVRASRVEESPDGLRVRRADARRLIGQLDIEDIRAFVDPGVAELRLRIGALRRRARIEVRIAESGPQIEAADGVRARRRARRVRIGEETKARAHPAWVHAGVEVVDLDGVGRNEIVIEDAADPAHKAPRSSYPDAPSVNKPAPLEPGSVVPCVHIIDANVDPRPGR